MVEVFCTLQILLQLEPFKSSFLTLPWRQKPEPKPLQPLGIPAVPEQSRPGSPGSPGYIPITLGAWALGLHPWR